MKIKKVFKVLRQKVKLRNLIFLVVILLFNSYAWFIYATKVSAGVSAHISSWNVNFVTGDGETETNINLDIDKIYPGMQTYTKALSVTNTGEFSATLNYEIKKIVILGQTYELSDGLTPEDLLNMLRNDFPFKFSISIPNGSMLEKGTTTDFTISVSWSYESGNDELDTSWGERAYQYNLEHPDDKSLHIELTLQAVQD